MRISISITRTGNIILKDNLGNTGTYKHDDLINKTLIQIIWIFQSDILLAKKLLQGE
mgnify:FL=1